MEDWISDKIHELIGKGWIEHGLEVETVREALAETWRAARADMLLRDFGGGIINYVDKEGNLFSAPSPN